MVIESYQKPLKKSRF